MSTRRFQRQPAIHMFAREFYESDLLEQGSGEYDPSFVITKLGAKTNRMLVAGLLEKMERRETDHGTMYLGSLRDPTGLHMFSVGSFQPEIHSEMEELMAIHEKAEPALILAVGKINSHVSDDGAVFNRIRLEEFTITDGNGYANWLVSTSDATLRRIDNFQKSRDVEPSPDAHRAVGIAADLSPGLITAAGHYGEVDPEVYMVGVLRALDRAEGNLTTFTEVEERPSTPPDEADSGGSENIQELIEGFLKSGDKGDGLAYDAIIKHCTDAGVSRSEGEATLDRLLDEGRAYEQSFGFFRHIDAS